MSVSVNYATSDETAQSGVDYMPATGTLEFPPGVTLLKLPVEVLGAKYKWARSAGLIPSA